MREDGLSLTFGRTPQAIAERLLEKAELASASLSPTIGSLLESYLAIEVPLHEAEAAIAGFEDASGFEVGRGKNQSSRFRKCFEQ